MPSIHPSADSFQVILPLPIIHLVFENWPHFEMLLCLLNILHSGVQFPSFWHIYFTLNIVIHLVGDYKWKIVVSFSSYNTLTFLKLFSPLVVFCSKNKQRIILVAFNIFVILNVLWIRLLENILKCYCYNTVTILFAFWIHFWINVSESFFGGNTIFVSVPTFSHRYLFCTI